jgi:lysozyme family protein
LSVFLQLYNGVIKHEGGYNPNDQGAPAYRGINRRYHPSWPGWKELDKLNPKRGNVFPALEPVVQAFYAEFWKPVKVDQLNSVKMAQLLVDMKTQHGGWAKIINAGINGGNPLQVAAKYGTAELNTINSNPELYYTKIAQARLYYCTHVPLKNEGDRKSIINRAKSFLNAAVDFVKENPKTAAGGGAALLLVAAIIFFNPFK